MQITSDKFKELYEKLLWDALLFQRERARAVVLQQYCNKLTVRSACSGDCKACGVHIASALQWMKDNNIPRMSYGIFGKVMKNAFAKRSEEMQQRPALKPETDEFGETTGRDALDILLETLDG